MTVDDQDSPSPDSNPTLPMGSFPPSSTPTSPLPARTPGGPAPHAEFGALDSLTTDEEGGTYLAHYKILEAIGRGGMGTVYRAIDTLLDRQVAVKVLADGLSADPELRDRFVREARIIARMSHPNLPQIHFVGRSENRFFFAMEWIEGENLETMIRRGPVAEAQALGMIRQVTIGLHAAHKAGIVHRDIKPANLMVSRDGVVTILDFGIARSVTFDAGATATGGFVGTPHYASPEQARGEKADHRSDIYSAGEVLFALLAGRGPFTGDNPMAVLTDRLIKPVPELPHEIECSEDVRKLVRRMMAKDLADRHQDCEELLREVEDAAPGEPFPAKIGERAWAGMLDALLIGLPFVVMWAIFQSVTGYFPTTLAYDSALGRVLLGLFLLAWPCAYSVLLTDREGRTVGQRTQGIRTATRDAEAPTRRLLLLRALTIWGPIALGMSLQTDWPPAALALGVLGVKALIVPDIPWLLVQLWIMVLLLMPHLHRKGRHVADILSRTQIVEIRRPWRELTGGAKHRGWHASSLISRRSLVRTPVFIVWLSFAAFVLQQLSGLPGDFVEPGRLRVRETVVAGHPGWDRLIAQFGNEYLGPGDQMENPELLPLQRGLFFHLIYTSTPPSKPLWIANRLFGSKRKLFMKDATALRGKKWGGNRTAHTAALAPSSPDEAATWKEARWNSYHGSDMHFLRALMHERLKEEGFEVLNPEDFQGLFRQEKRFLLVAKGRLQVRVAGDPTVESINLPSGFVRVNNFGYLDGHWGGGWGQDPVPSFVIKGYAEEQDRLWGRATETIERVLSLE